MGFGAEYGVTFFMRDLVLEGFQGQCSLCSFGLGMDMCLA